MLLHPSCSVEGLKAVEFNVFEVFGDASASTLEKLELDEVEIVPFPSPFKLHQPVLFALHSEWKR